MLELNTIVAAIDDPESAKKLLTLACTVGEQFTNSRVFAIHAFPQIDTHFAEILFPYASLGDDREAIQNELIEHTRKRFLPSLKPFINKPNFRIKCGPILPVLHTLNASLGADLLIVGALGKDRSIALRIGHVAQRIIAESEVAVLVVRQALSSKIKHIIAAIDLTPESRYILKYAIQFAHAIGATITPVYVLPTMNNADHVVVHAKRNISGKKRKELVQLQQQIFAELSLSFQITSVLDQVLLPVLVEQGDPAIELKKCAAKTNATLIIAGKHRANNQQTKIGRISSHLLRYSETHMLLLSHETIENE